MEEKIIIIDGNSLINRTFYAIPELTTKDGVHTNAVYGFVSVLHKIFEDYNPDYITVAFDRKAPTFRHKAFDEYKAGRKKMPDELAEQFPILKEILDAFHIHRVEIDGFEADDLIGTIVNYSETQNIHPIVITGDKDALQLVSKKTKVFITKKGVSSLEEYDEQNFMNQYEVTPKQFIDVKGLMGDKSDNIPGVSGIGEKTAIKLIKEFESVENLLENVDQVSSPKLREKIREYAEQAVLSKKLATIMLNVPVEMSLDEFRRTEPDTKKLTELFYKLEFKKFLDKLKDQDPISQQSENIEIIQIDKKEKLDKLKHKMKDKKEIYVKVFSSEKNIIKDEIVGIYIQIEDTNYFVDIKNHNEFLIELKDIFEDVHIKKYGFEMKKDILALYGHNMNFEGIDFDLAIALYLIEPTRKSYAIEDIAYEYLNEKIVGEEELLGKGKKRIHYDGVEEEKLIQYGYGICNTVRKIKEKIIEKLKEDELYDLYKDIEIPLMKVLAGMEFEGFYVDQQRLEEIGKELNEKINALTEEIYTYAEGVFNINSTKQLGEILFDKLKLPPMKKTKTGYSTNIEVLEKLYDKHPIIPSIIEYRQLVKLKTTYIDGLIGVINPNTHKIHSSFHQTVTATGRISSTEPNLQNIPIKLEVGRKIRKVFVPTNEDYVLLDADYSQIELRILAHISKDENLIEAFHQKQDIHASTASKVFHVPIEEVSSLQRSRAKAVNFGIVYGISDYGLSENLHITKKEAQRYIDEYFSKYEGVKNYMDHIVEVGKEKGYVTTILNRRRYIPELKSKNFNIRSFGERTAMNTPIQGSAADIIKIAMIRVYEKLKNKKLKSKLILQVHDELMVETHKDEIDEVKKIVKEEMENAISLKVPLNVDMNIGNSWYDTK
ncbi:DNA polymerase I [Inediibacterium massiliense]|uniref:DNA polymerase I n=1 Tax=Inediibacterium massiliense TaxID=1658111 RepID=UPI0006B4DA2F|nr:DNA polymerase I [Inediibacterium massiliense]